MKAPEDRGRTLPSLGLALGGVGWTALACLPLLAWLDRNRVRPAVIATTGFATLPAALWALGLPVSDIAPLLAAHFTHRVFYRRNPIPLLTMIGLPFGNRGLGHALWRSGRVRAAFARLFDDQQLDAIAVPLHVVLVDCLSGEFVTMTQGSLAPIAYASTALLPALPPLNIDGRWLGDASVYYAAPLVDLLSFPGLRHVAAVSCSFPPPEHYTSLVGQQLTLQLVLQKAGLKTGSLLALELLAGETVVLAARLARPVDPFDASITEEVVDAGGQELARSAAQLSMVLAG